MKVSRLTTENHNQQEQFAIDVLTGLCSDPKNISAKYFYDDVGSAIFQQITRHPDYYPTRIEFSILKNISSILPTLFDNKKLDIIELGAGDGHKSRLLLQGFIDAGYEINYFPIDISEQAMVQLSEEFSDQSQLHTHGVVGEYFYGLKFIREISNNPKLVLFLGSNIGNFDRVQNQGFLRRLWKNLNDQDHVLIGFDLKKDVSVLTAAYNDGGGHTSDFNINLLSRINKELGANFQPESFKHFGVYNPILGAMESYLLSTKRQEVHITELERSFLFKEFEPIHLEYSFKFLPDDINFLSQQTGYEVVNHFTDPKHYFVDSLWKVVKGVVLQYDTQGSNLVAVDKK